MANDTYHIERILKIFSYIMIGIILFTSLTFFGIISSPGSRQCSFPDNFKCENLVVRPMAIEFDLIYSGTEIKDFSITTTNTICTTYNNDLIIKSKQPIKIELSCSITAPKTKRFKDTLQIEYSSANRIGIIKNQATINAKVE
jgi:hypothetical protein